MHAHETPNDDTASAKTVEGIPSGNVSEIVPEKDDRESDLLGAGAPETLRHIQDDVRDNSEQIFTPTELPS